MGILSIFAILVFLLVLGGPEDGYFRFLLWCVIGSCIVLVLGKFIQFMQDSREIADNARRIRGKRDLYDTYIYVSVYFLNRGNWYYYLTEDPTIRPNDVVVVPWGKNNISELAIVGWVEHRVASDVPYPLNRMKYIIRKASDDCRPAFDEMIRWPMKVNISERWTRNENDKVILAVNGKDEREKLRNWICENPRLRPFECRPNPRTEGDQFWEAVRWYHIANGD